MSFPLPLRRRYLPATLLVLAAALVMVRLGFWQIDRLEQRRARNAEIARQVALPPLALGSEPLPSDLESVKYRHAVATGTLDLSRQVALKVQSYEGSAGIHLVAPLVLDGDPAGRAVLVDRGWLPDALAAPEQWAQFDEPGLLTLRGVVRLSEELPARAARSAPTPAPGPQAAWYRVDVDAIQAQLPYPLLPVYILQAPGPEGNVRLPYRTAPEPDLSEGSHLGYAIQWWLFAGIALVIYTGYIRKQATPFV